MQEINHGHVCGELSGVQCLLLPFTHLTEEAPLLLCCALLFCGFFKNIPRFLGMSIWGDDSYLMRCSRCVAQRNTQVVALKSRADVVTKL